MQIPMVVRERTVRVHATIPASQADALKALAAASGVPLARAVHYAVERLLDVSRRQGDVAVTGALAPATEPERGDGAVAEVAETLGLSVPDSEPEPREPVGGDGPLLLPARADPDGAHQAVHSREQESDRRGDRGSDHQRAHEEAQEADPPPAPAAAPVAAPEAAPAGGAAV